MELKSDGAVRGSVETNSEGMRNDRVSEHHGLNGEAEVQNNGPYNVKNNNYGDGDEKGKGNKVSGSGNSVPGILNSETSPSPATVTRKGYGLRKWKRIDRNAAKSSGGSTGNVDTSQFMKEERSNSGVNPSKRVQVYVEKESSENSVSSTNAMVKSFEGFALSGELILAQEALFGAGTDSDNSEDRSSKSSTAASGQPLKYDKPVLVGFPHDKNKLRTLSGKNLTHSVHRGQHGKVLGEASKKPGEGSVKILKETSISSLDSDSCSSVFIPEASSMNNGMRSGKQLDCEGEYDSEVKKNYNDQGDEKERNGGEGYEDISPENGVADSSSEVKVERKEVNCLFADKDPLVEAIDSLQYAQEALEKEMLKFREISKHVEDSISDIHKEEGAADEQNLQETNSNKFSKNEEVENEIELLLKNKIEAEVEYLAISNMVRNLKADAEEQITLLKEKTLASTGKLTDTRNKAVMLKNEAEEFEKVCEEPSKLQKKICKNASYFFLQMVLLVFIFGLFKLKSQSYEDVVPT